MSQDNTTKKRIFLYFVISYKCTNECKHCAVQGSPNQDEITIKLEDVKKYLEDVTSNFLIEEVGFFGGEPLLYFDLLVSLIEEVKRFDIQKIGFPTNGYWGKNDYIAEKYAQKLKEAGLYRIGFSVDAFHQEFISLDVLRRAIKAAHEARIEWIALMPKYLGSENEKNSFNEKTNDIIETLSKEFDFCEVIKSEVLVAGRAAKQLAQHYSLKAIPADKCLHLKAPMYAIDPNGWVFNQACYGISIGNTNEKPLSDIIREFNPRKHPIIGKLLAREGPKNLLNIAVEKGYKPQEGYADKCHLCFSTRNFLRPFYPNIFEPSNLYL